MFSLSMLLFAAHTVAAPVQPPVGTATEVRGAVPPSVTAVNEHLADHKKAKPSASASKVTAKSAITSAAGKRSAVATANVPAAVAKTPLPRSSVNAQTTSKAKTVKR